MAKISDTLVSCLTPSIPEPVPECDNPRQRSLMASLEKRVEQDDGAAINSLLDDKESLELIVKGLKNSPYSLVHQAAAQRKDKALMAMMKKLPIDVWNFRTKENLEHTPPIMAGRTPIMFAAESNNGHIIFELLRGVSCYVYDRQDVFGQALPSQESLDELDALRAEFKCQPGRVNTTEIWQKIINAQDEDGNTPLLLAISKDRYESFYQLHTLGAKPHITNSAGHSAHSVILASPDGPIRQSYLKSTARPSLSARLAEGCTIS